jgi:hypothetical protein
VSEHPEIQFQDLEGDPAVVPEVEVHRRHAALPGLPLDAVAVGESAGQAVVRVSLPRCAYARR